MVALAEADGLPPRTGRRSKRPPRRAKRAERPVYIEPLFGPEDWRSLAGVLALQAMLACLVAIAAHPPHRPAGVVIALPPTPPGLAPPLDLRQAPLPSVLPPPAKAPSLPEDRPADRLLIVLPLRIAVETEIRYPTTLLRDGKPKGGPDPRADRLDGSVAVDVAVDAGTRPDTVGVPLVAADTLPTLSAGARLADIAAPPLTWLPDQLPGPVLSAPALGRLPEGLAARGFETTGHVPVPDLGVAGDFPDAARPAPVDRFADRLADWGRPAPPAADPLPTESGRRVVEDRREPAPSETDRMLAGLDQHLPAFDPADSLAAARSLDAVIGNALDAADTMSGRVAMDPAAPHATAIDGLADLSAPRGLLDGGAVTIAAEVPTDHLDLPAGMAGTGPWPGQVAMDGLALRPLPTTEVRSVRGLRTLLDRGVDPQAVTPVFVSRLPADIDAVSQPDERKSLFVRTLLPIVVAVNERNLARRERIERLADLIDRGIRLKPVEQSFIEEVMAEFGLTRWNRAELLSRVDVVPPSLALAQAAEESGWGTSAAARTANALFGQMLPPSGGQPATVRPFDDLPATVEAYIRNLNTHRAYADFRRHRAAMRAAGTVPDGEALAQYLHRYSERGSAYIASVSALIRNNNFGSFDDARLARVPVLNELAAVADAPTPAWVR